MSENKWPKVAIIVLNWNGWRDTIECLESLYQITYPNYEVILVDNGSEDASIDYIRKYCDGKNKINSDFFEYDPDNKPIKIIEYTREEAKTETRKSEYVDLPQNKKITIIKNEKNYGFAEGNNIAMRYAIKILNPEYILLLNNDAVAEPNFLETLINVSEDDKRVGVAGPTIYHYDEPMKIASAGGKFCFWTGKIHPNIEYNKMDNNQFDKIKEGDYVSGCALLIKQDLIKKIGLLNKNYFAYYEEIDWCTRAKKNKYKIVYVPKAKLWHKISSTSRKINGFYLYFMTRNHFLFMKRNSTLLQLICSLIYFFLFSYIYTIIKILIQGGDLKLLNIFNRAIYDGIFCSENAKDASLFSA